MAANGELEELLGLLLRGEAGELGEFRVYGVGGGLRRCRGACVCKLSHSEFGQDSLEAADFKTCDSGEDRENHES